MVQSAIKSVYAKGIALQPHPPIILISANAEWRAVKPHFPHAQIQHSPYGEFFQANLPVPGDAPCSEVIFLHGGWGKISAAASAQYAIDRWQPHLLVNLGTCGGFSGRVERGAIVLVEKTIVYDIIEQMSDAQQAIADYATQLDLSWLPQTLPHPVLRTTLVSADRDLLVQDIPDLITRYDAVAGDWESGAIAYVAAHNQVRLLILRGVTDLVGSHGGDAYGNWEFYQQATNEIMSQLLLALPDWLAVTGS